MPTFRFLSFLLFLRLALLPPPFRHGTRLGPGITPLAHARPIPGAKCSRGRPKVASLFPVFPFSLFRVCCHCLSLLGYLPLLTYFPLHPFFRCSYGHFLVSHKLSEAQKHRCARLLPATITNTTVGSLTKMTKTEWPKTEQSKSGAKHRTGVCKNHCTS